MAQNDEYGSGSGSGEEIELSQLPQLPLRPSLYDMTFDGKTINQVFWPEAYGVPPNVGPSVKLYDPITKAEVFAPYESEVIPSWVWLAALAGLVFYVGKKGM